MERKIWRVEVEWSWISGHFDFLEINNERTVHYYIKIDRGSSKQAGER